MCPPKSALFSGERSLIGAILPTVLLLSCFFSALAVYAQGEAKPALYSDWSAGDLAFKKAMNQDLTYGVEEGRTQASAAAAWTAFLDRDDAKREQRVFAIWRLGSLWSYNFDRVRDERPDPLKARALFRELLEIAPDIVSRETVNAATQYASQPSDEEIAGAQQRVFSYRWLRTRTEQMLEDSAHLVSTDGSAVDRRFRVQGVVSEPSIASAQEKLQVVRKLLADGEERLVVQICEFIENSRNELAVASLLNGIENVADPDHLARFRNVKSKFESEWESRRLATELLNELGESEFGSRGQNTEPVLSQEQGPLPARNLPVQQDDSRGSERRSTQLRTVVMLVAAIIAIGIVLFVFLRRNRSSRTARGAC